MFSNAQSQIYHTQDVQHLLRNNPEIRFVYNLLLELEKPVHLFKPLIGVENLKLVNINYNLIYLNKPNIELIILDFKFLRNINKLKEFNY